MQAVTSIQFDDEEIEVFRRALQGHERAIIEEPRHSKETEYRPVAAHLRKIDEHHERYDTWALSELDGVLQRLVNEWQPQTTAAYWRDLGAPGADDAVEGLALERREAIRRVGECRIIVSLALDTVGRIEAYAARLGHVSLATAMTG